MPRIRAAAVTAGAVPVELMNVDDLAWQSRNGLERWCRHHGLDLDRHADYGPRSRLRSAAEAWAIANGVTNRFGRAHWRDMAGRGIAYPRGFVRERIAPMSEH